MEPSFPGGLFFMQTFKSRFLTTVFLTTFLNFMSARLINTEMCMYPISE